MAKLNILDRVQAVFNPIGVVKKLQARNIIEANQRAYEASGKGRRNDGWKKTNSTGAEETKAAYMALAAAGSELVRNNPLASRIKNVWASNIVGNGITPQLQSSTKLKLKKYESVYKQWAGSTACDYEGHYNLAGLQWLWAATVVETGGVFIRKIYDNTAGVSFPLRLQTLEQSYLDSAYQELYKDGSQVINGIKYSKEGKLLGYYLKNYINTTGMPLSIKQESNFFTTDEVTHIFKKDRAGQPVGISWFAPVATTLANFDRYQDAKLMQQSIAACFGAIVTKAENQIGVQTEHNDIDAIEPGMIEYMPDGAEVHQLTPPKADNATEFDVGLKRNVAVGVNLTYEQLTGDYSKVNFASGRMGKTEFFTQLDYCQNIMMKPALNKVQNWFGDIYVLEKGPLPSDLTWQWVFPPRQAVNPREEFEILFQKVRSGAMTPSELVQSMGKEFEPTLQQWKKDQELFDSLGLKFDCDPRYFARTGNQLDENDAATQDSENSELKKEKQN